MQSCASSRKFCCHNCVPNKQSPLERNVLEYVLLISTINPSNVDKLKIWAIDKLIQWAIEDKLKCFTFIFTTFPGCMAHVLECLILISAINHSSLIELGTKSTLCLLSNPLRIWCWKIPIVFEIEFSFAVSIIIYSRQISIVIRFVLPFCRELHGPLQSHLRMTIWVWWGDQFGVGTHGSEPCQPWFWSLNSYTANRTSSIWLRNDRIELVLCWQRLLIFGVVSCAKCNTFYGFLKAFIFWKKISS